MKKAFSLVIILTALLVASCQEEVATTGTFRGTLTYDSESLTGATVTITGDQGIFSTTVRDEGFFIMQEIPAGTYEISCQYNGKEIGLFYIQNQDKVSTSYFQSLDTYYEDYREYLDMLADEDESAVEPTKPSEPTQIVNDHHITIEGGNDHLRTLIVPLSENLDLPTEQ